MTRVKNIGPGFFLLIALIPTAAIVYSCRSLQVEPPESFRGRVDNRLEIPSAEMQRMIEEVRADNPDNIE